ncbi:MAG: transcription termination factor NusA [Acutalibacteraceae bacterium]
MNKEFFEAVELLEKEKGISSEYIFEKINAAILSATKNSYGSRDNVVCEINPEKRSMRVYVKIDVVDEVLEPGAEMTVDQARNYDENAVVGGTIELDIDPKKFGRIVAQTAKSVIRQGIREAERELAAKEIQNRNHEVVTAKVEIVYPDTGDASISIGRATAILNRSEMIPGEKLNAGDLIKVYVSSIVQETGTSYATISRKHPGFVRGLFEQEVPEIYDGVVEIVSVSREAGSRTKIAVKSNNADVDAVGACIGHQGQRVNNIVESLCGEKIDIVRYSDEPEAYIGAALAPAEVLTVTVDPSGAKSCRAIVPDSQLSLAIGNKGQNVRLAAKLTGWKIDIKPLSSANA